MLECDDFSKLEVVVNKNKLVCVRKNYLKVLLKITY